MGGEDGYDALIPFETIVRKGVLVREIEDRKHALVEQCRSNSGLTLQEVIEHNDWLLQVERDLSKARARIERDFRISNALSLKVREGKRKAQLQQRLDVLRSQCDVLNECIHGLSDHCAWFQVSGTYREAVGYLEGRWDDEDGASLEESRFDFNSALDGDRELGAVTAAAVVAAGRGEDRTSGVEDGFHHELDGLIRHDSGAAFPHDKKRRKKRRGKKGVSQGAEEAKDGPSDEEEEGEPAVLGDTDPWADFAWLRTVGRNGDDRPSYVDVWSPD